MSKSSRSTTETEIETDMEMETEMETQTEMETEMKYTPELVFVGISSIGNDWMNSLASLGHRAKPNRYDCLIKFAAYRYVITQVHV